MTQNNETAKRFGPAGHEIAARFESDLKATNLRNAPQISEHVERSVIYAHALAGMKHGLCNHEGRPFLVRFDLDDDPEPNGACVRRGDHFDLLLTRGLLYQQLELCGFVAARLTTMGLTTPAILAEAGSGLRLTQLDPPILTFSTIMQDVWPAERERSQFGGDLFETVLKLVWGHELAHAQFAHADFVREFSLTTLNERSRSFRPDHAETLRALEMQADWHAASYLCNAILASDHQNMSGLLALIPMAGALLGLTWHALDSADQDSGRTHPAPRERARLALVAVAATLTERGRRDLVVPLAAGIADAYADLPRLGAPFDMLADVGIDSALADVASARREIHAALHDLAPGLYERRYRFVEQSRAERIDRS